MANSVWENSTFAQRIRSAAKHGVISHAVILSGTGDRVSAARYLAAAQLCQAAEKPCMECNVCRKVMENIHPDVITVQETERKELAVDTVRELKQDVYIRPNEGDRKVYLFADCSQLNERDQNVLLKIVEEGPAYASFIFCTESAHMLLPTIRSRCVTMDLREEDAPAVNDDAIALCRAIGAGSAAAQMQYIVSLENRKLKREELQAILQGAWEIAAETLLQRSGKAVQRDYQEGIAALRALTNRQVQNLTVLLAQYAKECNYNVGVGHVLGALLAVLSDNQEVKQ